MHALFKKADELTILAINSGSSSLRFMGLHLHLERNLALKPDADLARPDSPARIFVIHTREELMVAREARRIAATNAL